MCIVTLSLSRVQLSEENDYYEMCILGENGKKNPIFQKVKSQITGTWKNASNPGFSEPGSSMSVNLAGSWFKRNFSILLLFLLFLLRLLLNALYSNIVLKMWPSIQYLLIFDVIFFFSRKGNFPLTVRRVKIVSQSAKKQILSERKSPQSRRKETERKEF